MNFKKKTNFRVMCVYIYIYYTYSYGNFVTFLILMLSSLKKSILLIVVIMKIGFSNGLNLSIRT